MRIILASSSPRRQELLKLMNLDFEIMPSNIEEKLLECTKIEKNALLIAQQKATDIFEKTKNDRIVIGADTIVVFKNTILGKPRNKQEAKRMLEMLRNNNCTIYTGMHVIAYIGDVKKEYSNLSCCNAKFSSMTQNEIDEYIKTNEPMDKAGGFAIQGIGAKYIENIQGDFYSGIGLSIYETHNIFRQINVDFNIEFNFEM